MTVVTEARLRATMAAARADMSEFSYDDEAREIAPGLFASSGSTSVYCLATAAGRVIINTGLGFEAPHHRRVLDAACPGPTRYIITTQGHTDHVGGVAAFREPGTIYLAQANNAAVQHDDQRVLPRMQLMNKVWFDFDPERVKALIAENPELMRGQDIPVPDETFDEFHQLDVGGVRIELHHGTGETVDGAMVWLPESGIAIISNLFGPFFGHFPNINTIRGQRYRSVEAYLASVQHLRDLHPEVLVSGRGEPVRGGDLVDAVLERMYLAVDHIHRTTLDGINAGAEIEDLMTSVTLPDELYVGQGYGLVMWGVKTILHQYLGWFDHRYTSDLYPVKRSTVHGHLVDLARAAAVVDRAEELLARRQHREATALLEAVLDRDPVNPAAREVLARCHRAELNDPITADNFWLSGWLRHQVEELS